MRNLSFAPTVRRFSPKFKQSLFLVRKALSRNVSLPFKVADDIYIYNPFAGSGGVWASNLELASNDRKYVNFLLAWAAFLISDSPIDMAREIDDVFTRLYWLKEQGRFEG